MRLRAYRLVQTQHLEHAMTGLGAKLYGGRWNDKGNAVVYLASSRSLAALETLVHLESALVLAKYTMIELSFPDGLLEVLAKKNWPQDWQHDPAPPSTKAVGTAWLKQASSALLAVPSTLVPQEQNYLFNPAHKDAKKLNILRHEAFAFDPRLT